MTARALAIARIARAARRFPDIDFRAPDDAAAHLDARDAALASAIEHAVLRRWLTLIAVIEKHLSRPWSETEQKLQAALLCGAAQLLLMDRLPEYAVIDETVEWAKTNVRPKAGGLINAVLRKVAAVWGSHVEQRGQEPFPLARNELPLDDGRTLLLNADVFANDTLPRLAQQTSHSIDLLEYWTGLMGVERAARLAAHDLVHAPIIVHGLDTAAAQSSNLKPHEQAGFFVLESHDVPEFLRANKAAIVQDPTSAAAVTASGAFVATAPGLIIDACAGRGTKTRQLALAYPNAEVIATDIDAERLRSLRETFVNHQRVRVIEHQRLLDSAGKADLVVLDVPCSNSGVLARRVEAKYRFSRARLKGLIDLQRQIIADSIPLLSERGSILYITCSIDPAENQMQAQWLTQWHPFQIAASDSREPKGLPGECAAAYHDGGYWALLARKPA